MRTDEYKYTLTQVISDYASLHNVSEDTIDSQLKKLDKMIGITKINKLGTLNVKTEPNNGSKVNGSKKAYDNGFYSEENKRVIFTWLDELADKKSLLYIFRANPYKNIDSYLFQCQFNSRKANEDITARYRTFKNHMDSLIDSLQNIELKSEMFKICEGFSIFDFDCLDEWIPKFDECIAKFERLLKLVESEERPVLRVKAENDWSKWLESVMSKYMMEEYPYARKR